MDLKSYIYSEVIYNIYIYHARYMYVYYAGYTIYYIYYIL